MKKIVLVMIFLMLSGLAQAATVFLKNGSTVSGTVIERRADAIKLDVSGVTLTYYNDEIQSIEDNGDAGTGPSASPVPEKSGQAEAAQPIADQPAATPPMVDQPAASQPVVEKPVVAAPVAPVAPVASKPVPAVAQPTVKVDRYAGLTKRELIYKFIEAFGTVKSMQANLNHVAAQLTPEQGEKFQKSYKITEIVDLLLPLYEKRFSEDELKAFIEFYSSPAGQKLVESIPLIMLESVEISEKYFSDHLPKDMFDNAPLQKR